MSAFGFVFVALGILVVWSGFKRVSVLDVLRSFLTGAKTVPQGGTQLAKG